MSGTTGGDTGEDTTHGCVFRNPHTKRFQEKRPVKSQLHAQMLRAVVLEQCRHAESSQGLQLTFRQQPQRLEVLDDVAGLVRDEEKEQRLDRLIDVPESDSPGPQTNEAVMVRPITATETDANVVFHVPNCVRFYERVLLFFP